MELRQLEYFIAAAKHLNITKAARECNIVQSAMSQQIFSLEKDLGVQLFERTNRGLLLTPEGEVLLREARRLLDHAELTREIVEQSKNSYVDVLRIGCHGNLLRDTLPRALADFRGENPHTRVLVFDGMYQQLLLQLREGAIDCVISLFHSQFTKLDWLDMDVICKEPIYAVLPKGHPLAEKPALSMGDLSGLPQILFNGDDKKQIIRDMQDGGIRTHVYAYTESQNCIETLVAGGYGISMCVRSAMRDHPGIVYRRMRDRPVGQTVLLWRKGDKMAEKTKALLSKLLIAQAE